MRKSVLHAAALFAALIFAAAAALPAAAGAESAAAAEATAEKAEPNSTETLAAAQAVYVGKVSTLVGQTPECISSFAMKEGVQKNYDTLVGNILHLTVYSTVPEDAGSALYLPLDSHIAYVDGTDRFTMTGRSGAYYCYEKPVRITGAGSFDLTVTNTNETLYRGLYDTIAITAYDSIESLAFYVEAEPDAPDTTNFFVTANGSATAIITPDTEGFNATDNEWKIVTAEKTERVLFEDTTYAGYAFTPGEISLAIHGAQAGEAASFEVYYLGLINGRLFTVGPYAYPASKNLYSSTFELARRRMDVLATEQSVTFDAYIEAGRTPDVTVTDANGVAALQSVRTMESDWDGMDKLQITVTLSDTTNDLDLLVGNRWSANQIAYNYRTLHLAFLREIQSLVVTAEPRGHYEVVYTAAVNGQSGLDTSAINWYINGALQPEHGLALACEYHQGGVYSVYAELGGLCSNTVQSSIIHTGPQAALWYILAGLAVGTAVLLLQRRSRLSGIRRDADLRRRVQALQGEVEQIRADYTAGALSRAQLMRFLRRFERRIGTVCDGLALRAQESNLAAYREAVQAARRAGQTCRKARQNREADAYYLRAALNTIGRELKEARQILNELLVLAAN